MENWDITIISNYVRHCFEQDTPVYLHYHNISHTESVVAHVNEIGTFYKLNAEDLFMVQAAAWFHDLGYLYGNTALHEYKGVSLMTNFMNKYYQDNVVQKVGEIILATRMSSQPRTILCKIISDADTYHFGTDKFQVTDGLVKKELEEMTGQQFPSWKEHSLFLLRNHEFHTTYCQNKLNAGKEKNIAILEKIIQQEKHH